MAKKIKLFKTEAVNKKQLEALAKAAKETHEQFLKEISERMTTQRAEQIRKWRVDEEYSWRAVADAAFIDWKKDACWQPPSNQIAGMALCEEAAKLLQENYMEEPWN